MARSARDDYPGAIHHVMARGVNGRPIFYSTSDRADFLDRIGTVLCETTTRALAWALMPNHLHFVIRTGNQPLSKLMQCVLTGYAMAFNHKYDRKGHLFQNRYKSINVGDVGYLRILVSYVHLNPLAAGLVSNLSELAVFPWSGHAAIVGRACPQWQDVDFLLHEFGDKKTALSNYLSHLYSHGVRVMDSDEPERELRDLLADDLLIPSDEVSEAGNTNSANSIDPSSQVHFGVDDKLPVDPEQIFNTFAAKILEELDVSWTELRKPGRSRRQVSCARAILCHYCVRSLGMKLEHAGRLLNMSAAGVRKAALRGTSSIEVFPLLSRSRRPVPFD